MATVPVNTDLDMLSASRILNLINPVLAQQPATKAYVDSAVEGLAWKDSVRVKTTANIALASPGATIDGITMVANDRFLAASQTAGAENGIYIWNGAAVAATRAPDMNTAAEVEQAITTVEEGTSAATSWRQTAVNVTLDTTALAFAAFGTATALATETVSGTVELATQAEADTGTNDTFAVTPLKMANWSGRKRKYTALFGDGAATSYTITHNLNMEEVQVYVYEAGGSKREVLCEKQHTGVNSVTLVFTVAVAANANRVVILG